MEVAMAEEKKKIFRARKTMKISDRQQLETLHSTLLSAAQQSPSNPSPSPPPPTAPLVNGTHKEEGPKMAAAAGGGDKEQNDFLDSNSPANSPVSPASRGSPPPSLSLNLSPSPTSSQSPKAREDTPPASPFQTINFDLKPTEEGKKAATPSPPNGCSAASPPAESKEGPDEEAVKSEKNVETTESNKKETNTTKDTDTVTAKDSPKPTVSNDSSPAVKEEDHSAVSNSTEPMETDADTTEATKASTATVKVKEEKTSSSSSKAGSSSSTPASTSIPASTSSSSVPTSSSSSMAASVPSAQEKETKEKETGKEAAKEPKVVDKVKVEKVKEEKVKEEKVKDGEKVKKGPTTKEVKMEVDQVKTKTEVGEPSKPLRPMSTPPSDTAVKVEKNPSSQLKRALSESEKDGVKVEREGKRPKVELEAKRPKVESEGKKPTVESEAQRPKVELEAQLELKITAKKANSLLKLEKIVQQVVAEQLKLFESTVIDKGLQELKDRVEKIECATKHQNSITTLQAKISRISKKFGEANQASENKRKQEALAAATAKSAAAAATAAVANAAASSSTATSGPITQITRLVRTSTGTPTTISTTSAISSPRPPTSSVSMPTSAPTTLVQQNQILQLITSSSNATSSLASGGVNTQSPMGTLILKTASGQPMMHGGQPLLIQLPMSMANCQPGTVVNIPASCLPQAKTNTTTTFIIKPAQAITTAATSVTATVPALQSATGQMAQMAQIVRTGAYQGGGGGGAGGISTTPTSGVTVTTARAPTQPVSVAGAMSSSSSSPAASGPAATGSTAPGPPQGTSLTSKTDNQATSSTPAKPTLVVGRPKGSVIDLTEDDDDVQVTGVVKNATVPASSATQRPHPVISVQNSAGAKSSTQSNGGSPQTTVHHRASVESPVKSRAVTTTPIRATSAAFLPPLPTAPQPMGRPPAEAAGTSPPQQPQLKLVPSPSGIVLSWCVAETDLTCAAVDSYHLYAFHQDNSNTNSGSQQHWKKIGEVKALPLPMACTLTQFQAGSTYHFAVRAKDIYGRFGSFCEPQCTNVISPNSG